MLTLGLCFCGVQALVECESEAFRDALGQLYRPAVVSHTGTGAPRYRVGAKTGVWETAEGIERQLAGPGAPDALAESVIFHSMACRVRTHWLLHGAALSGPEGGVLLVGRSGAGKTTLALALAQRGYGWLSDEVAAIDRASAQLVYFPRGALIRPGTLGLLPGLRDRSEAWPAAGTPGVACWHPEEPGAGAPLRHVLVLPAGDGGGPTQVTLSRLTSRLRQDLGSDPRLEGARVANGDGCVVLAWERTLPPEALYDWAQVCQREGVLLLRAGPVETRWDFTCPPRLEPASPSCTWLSLAGAAWNRPGGVGPEAVDERLLSFLYELGGLLGGAEYRRLCPGPLPDTVALVDGLCRRDRSAHP